MEKHIWLLAHYLEEWTVAMNIWATSDAHFDHKNICRGTSEWEDKSSCRDFDTLEGMNQCIMETRNECAKENDLLIILGDECFGQGKLGKIRDYRQKTRCKNILFSRGNHDPFFPKDYEKDQEVLKTLSEIYGNPVVDNRILFLAGKVWVCQHYAQITWWEQNHGSYHLFGHSHGGLTLPPGLLATDVGVDTNKKKRLAPFNLEEVRDDLAKIERVAYDHH